MRFRRIEKDTLGTGTEFIQADKKTMANSKTYIPKPRSKKVAMNKIKNTKVGDDIHYYINGMEGRGIVVKMANEYLEVFKEDGQLGTIHINDTFFVKDILINKQWDDMDDIERFDALNKIHAPSPRYITKQWHDIPEEIKVLLQKQMPGGTGSTFEQGESKESETKDHSRTGFAQNEQYSSKKPKGCKCGDPKCKDPKCKKPAVVKKSNPKGNQDESEGEYKKQFNSDGTRKQTRAGQEKEILGHYTSQSGTKGGRWAAEQAKKKEEEMAKKKKEEVEAKKKEPVKEKPKTDDRIDPDNPNYTMSGKRITSWEKKYGKYAKKKALYTEWLEKKIYEKKPRKIGEQTEKEFSMSRRGGGPKNLTNQYYRDGIMFEGEGEGSGERAYAKRYPKSDTAIRLANAAKPKGERKEAPKKAKGKFAEVENEAKESEVKQTGGFVLDESDYKDAANKSLYKQWLEKFRRPNPRKVGGNFGTTQSDEGQEVQANQRAATASAVGSIGNLFSGGDSKTASTVDDRIAETQTPNVAESVADMEKKEADEAAKKADKEIKAKKLDHIYRDQEYNVMNTATKTYLEIMKPAALPKGTKPNPNLSESFGEDEEYYKHLTPNQQKQYQQEDREREEDEPNAEEWMDIVERNEEGRTGKKGDKERLAAIERDEQKRLKDRKETGSQPANPKKKAETYEDRSTQKAYEVWLERQELNKVQLRYEEDERDSGKIEVEPDPDRPGHTRRARRKKPAKKADWKEKDSVDGKQSRNRKPAHDLSACTICGKEGGHGDEDFVHRELTSSGKKTGRRGTSFDGGEFTPDKPEDKSPSPSKKSDVEHGVYGNVGGSDGTGVSTDTKVDVTEGTGYEERPHISVEEAGKLPRTTFNESGSELTVSGSQDSKDEPKFSQPADQEQPVRKAGLPQQHPNTYGVRYGMKGGVKKVWCPEHQVWEETRKDWHE